MTYKKSDETRERILRSASMLFRTEDYDNVNMLDIAKAAGISRSSLYYYYESKYAIADHLFDVLGELVDRLAKEKEGHHDDPLDIVILTMYILFKAVYQDKVLRGIYITAIDYSEYDEANLTRLKGMYGHPSIWKVFEQYGKPLSENDKTTFLLTSNVMMRVIYKGITRGRLHYTLSDIMDYFFSQTMLDRLQIPFALYEQKRNQAVQYVDMNDLP